MKKVQIILVIVLVVFFEFLFRSCTAQVTIPDDVARFFLEQNDKAKLLEKQVEIKNQIISNLNSQLQISGTIIVTYIDESVLYKRFIESMKQQSALISTQLNNAIREVRRQKFQKVVTWVAGGVLFVLILI